MATEQNHRGKGCIHQPTALERSQVSDSRLSLTPTPYQRGCGRRHSHIFQDEMESGSEHKISRIPSLGILIG